MSCEECGAGVADFTACQALFREFNARAQSDPSVGAMWWAIVDAYAMQHVEQYGKSAKSYSAHLMGLCGFAEHEAAPEVYRAIHVWLDGAAKTIKPSILPPGERGTVTLVDVETSPARAREWVMSVWTAYQTQHALAREWLMAALNGKTRHRSR